MIIDNSILDKLTAQAKESPRLRMNLDLKNSDADSSQRMLNAIEPGSVVPTFDLASAGPVCALNIPAGQWHTLRALESGTVIIEMKDGAYEPIQECDVLR